MSEPETTPEETRWTRYRHRERPEIEYDVESYSDPANMPTLYDIRGEECHLIRTVRNLYFTEQVHQPAFTMMPAEGWAKVYERVED